MVEVDPADAWLAGLLEGEGTFGWHHGTPAVRLEMTDFDVVKRAARLMGLGASCASILKKKGKESHHLQSYSFGAYGNHAITVMQAILPYMGDRRSQKILSVLAEWRTRPRQQQKGTTLT